MRNRLDNFSLESCLRLSLMKNLLHNNRLNHLTNYTGTVIIALIYWF
jgi:hypothetical protein